MSNQIFVVVIHIKSRALYILAREVCELCTEEFADCMDAALNDDAGIVCIECIVFSYRFFKDEGRSSRENVGVRVMVS